MRIILTFLLTLFLSQSSLYSQTTNPSPYCEASYDDMVTFPVTHYFSNFQLGTFVNNSGTTQAAAPHYIYYNNLAPISLTPGNSYNLSLTHDPSGTIHFIVVYIDYNHDNDFNDSGEMVFWQSAISGSVTNPSSYNITIPTSALSGPTRLRAMIFEDDNYTYITGHTSPTPCTLDATGYLDWGETEDYNVVINGGSSSTPVAGFKVNANSGNTTSIFNFTDTSHNSPTSWQWSFIPNTITYQSGSSANSQNPSVLFYSPGDYTVKLKVTNASGSDSLSKSAYIHITYPLEINDQEVEQNVIAYPNPSVEKCLIKGSHKGDILTLTTLTGVKIGHYICDKSDFEMNVSNLPCSIYLLEIQSIKTGQHKVIKIRKSE